MITITLLKKGLVTFVTPTGVVSISQTPIQISPEQLTYLYNYTEFVLCSQAGLFLIDDDETKATPDGTVTVTPDDTVTVTPDDKVTVQTSRLKRGK